MSTAGPAGSATWRMAAIRTACPLFTSFATSSSRRTALGVGAEAAPASEMSMFPYLSAKLAPSAARSGPSLPVPSWKSLPAMCK
jgi:hypothetical protein